MASEYIHAELGKQVDSISGYYIPEKEIRLNHDNREVLCIFGAAVMDNSCCSAGGCGYAIVPGYIVNWKSKVSDEGLPVSEVEPIRDETARKEIAATLKQIASVDNINFL